MVYQKTSRELTYPTLGKHKSLSTLGRDMLVPWMVFQKKITNHYPPCCSCKSVLKRLMTVWQSVIFFLGVRGNSARGKSLVGCCSEHTHTHTPTRARTTKDGKRVFLDSFIDSMEFLHTIFGQILWDPWNHSHHIAKMLGTSDIVMGLLPTQFSPSIQAHTSTRAMNETKILACLGYIGDYTAQLCGDYNKQLQP